MKILIVGCGVIGTIYGWALAQAGQDVTHFVRPKKATTLKKQGIQLDIYDLRGSHEKSVHEQIKETLSNAPHRANNDSSFMIPSDLLADHPEYQKTTYRPHCIDDLSDHPQFDWVIVPVKHYQLIDTLKQIYPYLKAAKFLLFCGSL